MFGPVAWYLCHLSHPQPPWGTNGVFSLIPGLRASAGAMLTVNHSYRNQASSRSKIQSPALNLSSGDDTPAVIQQRGIEHEDEDLCRDGS